MKRSSIRLSVRAESVSVETFSEPPPEGGLDLVTNRQGAKLFIGAGFDCLRNYFDLSRF